MIDTLVTTLRARNVHAMRLTPANETTGILDGASRHDTCDVRGRVCHRGDVDRARFGVGCGTRRGAIFVISRTSVVTGAMRRGRVFKDKRLLSSLVRCMCSNSGYYVVFANSATRLPPIRDGCSPTLSPEGLRSCKLRAARCALARMRHRDREDKVLCGTAGLQASLATRPFRFIGFRAHFPSVFEINKRSLVSRVGDSCDHIKRRGAVVLAQSGGQTLLCGRKIHGRILRHRSRVSNKSCVLVAGGGCR